MVATGTDDVDRPRRPLPHAGIHGHGPESPRKLRDLRRRLALVCQRQQKLFLCRVRDLRRRQRPGRVRDLPRREIATSQQPGGEVGKFGHTPTREPATRPAANKIAPCPPN